MSTVDSDLLWFGPLNTSWMPEESQPQESNKKQLKSQVPLTRCLSDFSPFLQTVQINVGDIKTSSLPVLFLSSSSAYKECPHWKEVCPLSVQLSAHLQSHVTENRLSQAVLVRRCVCVHSRSTSSDCIYSCSYINPHVFLYCQ